MPQRRSRCWFKASALYVILTKICRSEGIEVTNMKREKKKKVEQVTRHKHTRTRNVHVDIREDEKTKSADIGEVRHSYGFLITHYIYRFNTDQSGGGFAIYSFVTHYYFRVYLSRYYILLLCWGNIVRFLHACRHRRRSTCTARKKK